MILSKQNVKATIYNPFCYLHDTIYYENMPRR